MSDSFRGPINPPTVTPRHRGNSEHPIRKLISWGVQEVAPNVERNEEKWVYDDIYM
jgi:hypothetical protein